MQITKDVLDALRDDAERRAIGNQMGLIKVKGTIKSFQSKQGYGLIKPDNDLPDILLHITCLRASGHKTANIGDRVECEVLSRPHGWQAFKILKLRAPY